MKKEVFVIIECLPHRLVERSIGSEKAMKNIVKSFGPGTFILAVSSNNGQTKVFKEKIQSF